MGNNYFSKNEKLGSAIGAVTIVKFLGAGGQGEVYEVESNGKRYALKWYHDTLSGAKAQAMKNSLAANIQAGSPNRCFLWPLALVEKGERFGYVMDLRPPQYMSMMDWVQRKFSLNLKQIATAGYELSQSFHLLHAVGLSYQDISWGNVFIDKNSGSILICDNDNVTTDNCNVSSILGTPKFMAPEIITGQSRPNSRSDRFSLAILLFHLLYISHPLDGKKVEQVHCWDNFAGLRFYGKEPLYVWDKNDKSNEPDAKIHGNLIKLKNFYPEYIQEKFYKTFTVGLHNPDERTMESEFRKAFLKLYNSIYFCEKCGNDMIFDIDKARNGNWDKCSCGAKATLARMRLTCSVNGNIVNEQIVCLSPSTYILRTHVDYSYDDFLDSPVAKVVSVNRQLFLENLRDRPIIYTDNGADMTIKKGSRAMITNGVTFKFGDVLGEVSVCAQK